MAVLWTDVDQVLDHTWTARAARSAMRALLVMAEAAGTVAVDLATV